MAGKIKIANLKETFNLKDLIYKFGLLSDLMKYIPDVIYFKDRSGRLVMVNDAHARGLGLAPGEVAGKTDFDFFPKQRAEIMSKDDRCVMRTGKPIIDKIERSTRPDGIDNYATTTKIPRYDARGRIIGLIGITRDITRRMQLEQSREENRKIEKKLEAMEELNREKSEFVSVVSHELRTPLAIIKEAVRLLLDGLAGGLNEKQKEILLKAENNVGRLRGIIEDLLDISRIESGRIKLRYSLVNLNNLLKETSDFFKKSAGNKGIEMQYVLPEEQVNIFLDADRINQVISNLISNAIKFTEEGGRIKVELNALEDRVRIGVFDTGTGIAKADLPKLFNKFMQVSRIPNVERKGLGLGLSIARELIERHSGDIWVESKSGVGSKFYFTLPRLGVSNMLDKQVCSRINNLLDRGLMLYFVNLVIVNYKEFKKKAKVNPVKLFRDLELIVNRTFKQYFRLNRDKPQIVSLDSHYGECSFLLPSVTEKKCDRVSRAILNSLSRSFIKSKSKNVFVNLGIMSYPEERADVPDDIIRQSFAANLKVKKIYIGPEIRKFTRIKYKMEVRVLLPGNKWLSSRPEGSVCLPDRQGLASDNQSHQSMDISRGGICFYSPQALKTDAEVEVCLRFLKEKEPLCLKGQIAWVRKIPGGNKGYKIGLEFIRLKGKSESIISRFLKSVKG